MNNKYKRLLVVSLGIVILVTTIAFFNMDLIQSMFIGSELKGRISYDLEDYQSVKIEKSETSSVDLPESVIVNMDEGEKLLEALEASRLEFWKTRDDSYSYSYQVSFYSKNNRLSYKFLVVGNVINVYSYNEGTLLSNNRYIISNIAAIESVLNSYFK